MKRIIFLGTFLLLVNSTFTLSAQQSGTISGKITTAGGDELSGVSIVVKGSTNGTTTDEQGEYQLTLVDGNYSLRISLIGYETVVHQLRVQGKNQQLDFTLDESVTSLNELVILGSRSATGRTNIDKAVPVDVIQVKEIKSFAQTDFTQILNYAVPSFSSNRQTVSDGTDHIDPASLRGLGPDQVLVLVNGKRRHTTALVNINGTFGRGTVGTDMNSIPLAAIERVEILRDGAAAQYGSDAIAGVINLILKRASPLTLSTTYGQALSNTLGRDFYDGKTFQFDLSKGFTLGKRGTINLAGQYLSRDFTNRSGLDTRPLLYSGLPSKGANESETDFNFRYATLKSDDDIKALAAGLSRNNMRVGNADSRAMAAFVNGEYGVSRHANVYLHAGFTNKAGKAAGFYRLPSQNSQMDLTIYPNGFLPFINTDINDISFSSGIKGELADWSYDVSNSFGQNGISFNINNTLNASLPPGTSPTSFDAGKLFFRQNTTNIDVAKKIDFTSVFTSLNMGYGAEFRVDNFEIKSGEELSWSHGQPSRDIAGVPGKAAGAQVFPGYRPANEVNKSRTNTGIYADFEGEFGSRVLIGAAGRFEHYSDFGSNFSYKSTVRIKLLKELAMRGSVSTGFRAPSLHQRFFNNESTQFVQGQPTQVLTANNANAIVRQFGVGSLKPEISTSYSFGVSGLLFSHLLFSLDAYKILINDRIVFSSQYARERDGNGDLSPNGTVNQILNTVDPQGLINSVQFFTNAIETRTRGLDIVLSDNFNLGHARKLAVSAAANFNSTTVEDINGTDVIESSAALKAKLFDRLERSRYESAVPKSKINISGNFIAPKWSVILRTIRFGEVAYLNAVDPTIAANNLPLDIDQTFSAKWITDLAFTYELISSITFTVGANNVFDIYPDKAYLDPANNEKNLSGVPGTVYTTSRDNTSNGHFLYSRNVTQFGFSGRFVFAKVAFKM